ncbi:MAG: hybrid sensor histidine kinase/response regulator [Vicinamibacterales bacterium]
MSWLTLGLGYALLYAIGGWLLTGYPAALRWYGSIGVLIPALLIVQRIVRRRRDWVGAQWLFWATIGTGFVLWIVGHLGWAAQQLIAAQAPVWLSWHTAFSLCGGVAPLLALLARPHLGPRHGALATTSVDIAGFALLTGFAYAYFIIVPGLDPPHQDGARWSLLLVIQVQRFGLLAAMLTAALLTRRRVWSRTYQRLAAGYAVGFVVRGLVSLAIVRGTYTPGSLYDLAWIVPFFFTLWAIDESPASEAEEAVADSQPSDPWLVTVALALVPLVGYGGYYLLPLGSAADDFRVLLTTLTTIAGLALLTVRTMVQRAELRRADARLRLLAAVAQQTGDLVIVFDRSWKVREANDAAVAALGYSREELARLRCPDLTAEEGHQAGREADRALQADQSWRGTLVRRRKNGSIFPASCTIGALRDEAGRVSHFVAVERDITDELRVRDQLISTERLAAVGEVVSGVAHEINNPLQAIMGCTELLLDGSASLPEQARKDLQTVRAEAGRAGQIVRNLLGFVHRGAGERGIHDVNAIVRKIAALRVYHLRQMGIDLDVRCHPEPLVARVSEDDIKQVLANLILNAEHAIAASGRGSRISLYTWRDAHGIAVQVADDGPGVPAEVRGRIFEPFFTTRQVGEATGLGLSISLGVAIAHGGHLEFAPSSDGGASFRLTLPPLEDVDRPAAVTEIAAPASGSGPRALVVDDEESVRLLLVRMLERRGFQVLQAAGGEAALALLAGAAFDLVVCDAQLPRITGAELFVRSSARRPQLQGRFVLISEDGAPNQAAAARAGLPLLSKPFTASQLDEVLRSLSN